MNAQTKVTAADTAAPNAEIITAIIKAMGAIKKVGKGGTNTHDKYNFASIDNFLELVNPVCADAGLMFQMQQVEIEDFSRQGKYAANDWMRVTYEITAYHVSGQSLPPIITRVEVLRNGAQAYGSAQSYALKQFLRGLFLIPTGDKDDADYAEKADGPIERPQRQPERPAFDVAAATNRIKASLAKSDSLDDLRARWTADAETIQRIKAEAPGFYGEIEAAKNARKDELEPRPSDSVTADEIPY